MSGLVAWVEPTGPARSGRPDDRLRENQEQTHPDFASLNPGYMHGARTATLYRFHPMTADDLPMVRGWLREPHVREWWGDPDEQFDLVSGDMNEPAMDQHIVSLDQSPFAYLQCYRLTDWNTGFGPQPDETRGIDQMIGVPSMIGRGHGSGFIRAFIEDLLKTGTPRVVTDPDPKNARAIRAYEKAGFARDKLVDTPDGISLLMVRDA